MNLDESSAGDCGTTIFWKHVGHSIRVPLALESLLMCWPQTGQANLNSVMLTGWQAGSHAAVTLAGSSLGRNLSFTFESDFFRGTAHICCGSWSSGFNLFVQIRFCPDRGKLKLELQQR